MTGFKGRSGKSFRARLALQQSEDGKWRVEFDEPWAKEGAKPPEAEEAAGRRRSAGRGAARSRVARRRGRAARAVPSGATRHHSRRMPLELVLGPANSAKAGEVLGAYAAAAHRGALLVVPDRRRRRALRARARRARAPCSGRCSRSAGWRARSPAGPATRGRRLSALQRERVLRRARAQRRRFQALADAAAGARVRDRGRQPDRRARSARWSRRSGSRRRCAAGRRRTSAASPYARDVAAIYLAYAPRARARSGGSTPTCTRGGRSTRCGRRPGGGASDPVFFYGFDDLHPLERDAVETLARVVGVAVTVSLTYEAGPRALGARAEVVEELRPLAERVRELPALDEHYDDGLARRAAPPRAQPVRALARRASSRATRCACSRPAASAPRPSWSRPRCSSCCAPGCRARRSSSSTARRRRQAPLIERVFEQYGIDVRGRAPGPVRRTPRSAAGCSALARCALLGDRARAEDLLDYLRSPGIARSPGARRRARGRRPARGTAHRRRRRASGSAGRSARSTRSRRRLTRRRSWPSRPAGCSPRRTGGGRRCSTRPRSSTPARCRRCSRALAELDELGERRRRARS